MPPSEFQLSLPLITITKSLEGISEGMKSCSTITKINTFPQIFPQRKVPNSVY